MSPSDQLKGPSHLKIIGLLFSVNLLVAPALLPALSQEAIWQLASGTNGLNVADLDIYLLNPDTIYAFLGSGRGPQLAISTDYGTHWDTLARARGFGVSTGALKVDPFNSEIVYESYAQLGPQQWANAVTDITTDGGFTWNKISVFMNTPYQSTMVEVNPISRRAVYLGAGNGVIKRSRDSGLTWEDLPVFPTFDGPGLLSICQGDTNTFYAVSTIHYLVFRSTDSGNSWLQVSKIPSGVPSGMAVDPRNDSTLYVAANGVFKSTDRGESWLWKVSGLSDSNRVCHDIVINPGDPTELLAATGYPHWVFRSTNAGESWEVYDTGLPNSFGSGRCISIDTIRNRIYLGTTSGIYYCDRVTSTSGGPRMPVLATFELLQNYPNPFNAETVIEVSLARSESISLRVYSLLGEVVAELCRGTLAQGVYSFVWDASGSPSGVYIARLASVSNADSRLILLLK